jgi:hypothetical protein
MNSETSVFNQDALLEKKLKLEKNICELFQAFTTETGLDVLGISLVRTRPRGFDAMRFGTFNELNIVIGLE